MGGISEHDFAARFRCWKQDVYETTKLKGRVELHSAPRAVGQACGANRLPIVIPCHRVIAKSGGLGGFMHASDGMPLDIKRWLLRHECA